MATGGTESDYETDGNYNKGPVTAIKQIPTRTQWKNVKLSNTIRNITDEKKTVRVNNFSYSGYAARLLTSQEVNKECEITVGDVNKGELSSKCEYLMENTKYSTSSNTSYGPWLENVHNLISKRSWYIVSNNCLVNNNMFHV